MRIFCEKIYAFVKLILPIFIPSWRFFHSIAPSPRVEYALLSDINAAKNWCEFRPRRERVPFMKMLGRLFWNAPWNENLFMVSCAERLIENPTAHSHDEIAWRIAKELSANDLPSQDICFLIFRVVFIYEEDNKRMTSHILYSSEPQDIKNILEGEAV